MWIDFVKFTKDVICSTEGSADAVGFELSSVEGVIIPPSNVRIVWTDIGFKIPSGYFGKFHSRSSFALQFIYVGGAVIDADYRGLVALMFFYYSNRVFEISEDSRFAQITFQKIAAPSLREVDKFDNKTWHDQGSFGSSGLKHVMCDKILVHKYIAKIVPSDFLWWYKRDGILTYIDQWKYEQFMSNSDKYLEKTKVINFEMIHAECCGAPRTYSDKHYQTV